MIDIINEALNILQLNIFINYRNSITKELDDNSLTNNEDEIVREFNVSTPFKEILDKTEEEDIVQELGVSIINEVKSELVNEKSNVDEIKSEITKDISTINKEENLNSNEVKNKYLIPLQIEINCKSSIELESIILQIKSIPGIKICIPSIF